MFAKKRGGPLATFLHAMQRLLLWSAMLLSLAVSDAMAFPNLGMRGDILLGGQSMQVGESLVSPSGEFFLTTQSDGNLCVYHEFDNKFVWCSRSSSAGEGAYVTGMQTDGNLCTANVNGNVAWCLSNEARDDGPFFLAMQNDANVCVYKGIPGNITGTVWCTMALATPRAHAEALRYGQIYTIQNGYRDSRGGYLDVRGGHCEDNALCVSTARSDHRDSDSGSWMIVSAESKPDGQVVRPGDKVYLKNQYRYGADDVPPNAMFGGYLDVRGGGCEGNVLCVSTSLQHNRDAGSGIWTVEAPRFNIYIGQELRLRNNYLVQGKYTYLDVRGAACEGNLLCVSTSYSANRDQGSGIWRFDDSANGYPMSAQTFFEKVGNPPNGLHVENTDVSSLQSGKIPTYFQFHRAGQQMRIKYWSFYGYQNGCIGGEGSHNGDWESVVVTVGDNQSTIAAVTFAMHGDYYTRLLDRNGFELEDTSHPVVYVGKTSHASFYSTGGSAVPCTPWDESRTNANGTHYDTWSKLVDLNGSSESWIEVDRAAPIRWGYDGVTTGPTNQGPSSTMNAAHWDAWTNTWAHSHCKKGDSDLRAECLQQCRSGYTDTGLFCTNSNLNTYAKTHYGFDYAMPTQDRGLLIDDN